MKRIFICVAVLSAIVVAIVSCYIVLTKYAILTKHFRSRLFYKVYAQQTPKDANADADLYKLPAVKYDPAEQPKHIFRIWCRNSFSGKCGGRKANVAVSNITKKNSPGWNEVVFSDQDAEEFLTNHFGPTHKVTQAYHLINPKYGAARADLLRYLLVYVFGGLYLDMKSGVVAPLENIPEGKDIVVARWPDPMRLRLLPQKHVFPGGEFQNWFVYARRGSRILEDVIRFVVQNIFDLHHNPYLVDSVFNIADTRWNDSDPKRHVLAITGPIAFTHVILTSKHKHSVLVHEAMNDQVSYKPFFSFVGRGHYSKQTKPIIFKNKAAVHIPKHILIVGPGIVPGIDPRMFTFTTLSDAECLSFIEENMGKNLKDAYMKIRSPDLQKQLFVFCYLYVHGGCFFQEGTVFQKPLEQVCDFKQERTWYAASEKFQIVTPPGNRALLECIRHMCRHAKNLQNGSWIKKVKKYTNNLDSTQKNHWKLHLVHRLDS